MFNGYNYPWTNLHDINLDWLIDRVKTLNITAEDIQKVEDIAANFSGYMWPTVKTYGAKGDGVTDDTQAFLDCYANEKWVIVPEGTYKLASTCGMQGNDRHIIGWPFAKIIHDNGLSINMSDNVSIENLEFTGADGRPNTGFTFFVCNNVVARNCIAHDCATLGLEFSNCGHTLVDHCEVYNIDNNCGISFSTAPAYEPGLYGNNNYRLINDCYCHQCGLDGIIANTWNVTITNCICNQNGTHTKAAGIYANNKNNLIIQNCTCNYNTGNGIDLVDMFYVTIENCFVVGNECAGIFLGNGRDAKILNNICNGNGSDPIDAYQNCGIVLGPYNGVNSTRLWVKDNICASNYKYGYRYNAVVACYIDGNYAVNNTDGDYIQENGADVQTTTYTPLV